MSNRQVHRELPKAPQDELEIKLTRGAGTVLRRVQGKAWRRNDERRGADGARMDTATRRLAAGRGQPICNGRT